MSSTVPFRLRNSATSISGRKMSESSNSSLSELPKVKAPIWFLLMCDIFRIISMASETLSARKNTHPKQTKVNVSPMFATRPNMLFELNLSHVILKRIASLSRTMAATRKNPCSAPQTTNVQLAPCHRPLIRKVMKRLKNHRDSDVRLPPSGM